MRRKFRWLPLMIALLCMISTCSFAETNYHTLCLQHNLRNADVIAWLEIPGASICEPVMRHPEDDAYYAKRAADGTENTIGSLYVQQKYNAADFSDPVTLIYGSSAAEAAPFGKLQELFSGSFENCRQLYMHLPDETREYVVFAALPYSSLHILHYYDFRAERRYNAFFDSVFSTRVLSMHLDEDNRPEPEKDRVVILSTALRGDSLQRYVVMARNPVP